MGKCLNQNESTRRVVRTLTAPRAPHHSLGQTAYAAYLKAYGVYVRACTKQPPPTKVVVKRQGKAKATWECGRAQPTPAQAAGVKDGKKADVKPKKQRKARVSRQLAEIQASVKETLDVLEPLDALQVLTSDTNDRMADMERSAAVMQQNYLDTSVVVKDAVRENTNTALIQTSIVTAAMRRAGVFPPHSCAEDRCALPSCNMSIGYSPASSGGPPGSRRRAQLERNNSATTTDITADSDATGWS